MPNYDIYIFTFYDIALMDILNEISSMKSNALNKIDTQCGQMKMCNISFTHIYMQACKIICAMSISFLCGTREHPSQENIIEG